MNTNKGYTGQYADPLTGFDYYNARYYDPVCGTFLSADPVEGNMQGMNPYAYVGGNPETYTDPTGKMYAPPSCQGWCWVQQQWNNVRSYVQQKLSGISADAQQQWSEFIADPKYYMQQQLPAQVTKEGISVTHIVIGALLLVGIGVSIALWRFSTSGPNGDTGWLTPSWANLRANEGVPHDRYTPGGTILHSSQHALSDHVFVNRTQPERKARKSPRHDGTAFYSPQLAQETVDYALHHMTEAQEKQLADLIADPTIGGEMVLTGTMYRDIGYGYHYDRTSQTYTKVNSTATYEVRIAVDANGNPFIVTAYPTI